MLAIHDQFNSHMRSRLKTTGMGLGLVQLLQDAGLTAKARTTLSSLDHGFHSVAEAWVRSLGSPRAGQIESPRRRPNPERSHDRKPVQAKRSAG
jgi:hypothetical protein